METVRRGQVLRISVGAVRGSGPVARNVRLELRLPASVRPLRLPRGARFERRTRRVLLSVPRLREAVVRVVRARVRRGAMIGAPIELVFYARARGDQLPLTDRWVDRDTVARRARRSATAAAMATASARRYGVCMLARP